MNKPLVHAKHVPRARTRRVIAVLLVPAAVTLILASMAVVMTGCWPRSPSSCDQGQAMTSTVGDQYDTSADREAQTACGDEVRDG